MMYKGTKRQKIWRHNSFFGHVAMGKAHMNDIMNSSTATKAAKEIAYEIWTLHNILAEELKERVDANPR